MLLCQSESKPVTREHAHGQLSLYSTRATDNSQAAEYLRPLPSTATPFDETVPSWLWANPSRASFDVEDP